MRSSELDAVSLVAGLTTMAVGGLFLADRLGVIDVTFGWLWPILCAAAGLALLTSGVLARRRDGDR